MSFIPAKSFPVTMDTIVFKRRNTCYINVNFISFNSDYYQNFIKIDQKKHCIPYEFRRLSRWKVLLKSLNYIMFFQAVVSITYWINVLQDII